MKVDTKIEEIISAPEINSFYKIVRCINDISSSIEKEITDSDDLDNLDEIISKSDKFQKLLEIFVTKLKEKKLSLEQIELSDLSMSIIEIYKALTNQSDEELNYSLDNNYNAYKIYLNEVVKVPLLSAEEERKLLEEYFATKDIKIKKKLVNHNLRLVISIAKTYQNSGLEFLDLIQEGNLGLMDAIDHFNPEKTSRLSTYAVLRIRRAISRAIKEKGKTIRIPYYLYDEYNELSLQKKHLEEKFGREVSNKEIAKEMGISENKIDILTATFSTPISLNNQLNAESETDLQSMIKDDAALDPEKEAIKAQEVDMIKSLLGSLTEKEAEIIKLRFGIDNNRSKTMEEVSKIYNCTQERIRKIESQALRKLRRKIKSSQKNKKMSLIKKDEK